MDKIIKNKVTNCPTISWDIIKTWEFNQLKDNSNRDITKLKNSILNNGFIAPFDCWKNGKKNFIIDGTGRNLALLQLETEGYNIPELPVLFIDAKDLKEAKKFALQRSSTHGEITQSSLADFTSVDFDIEELKELQLEELNLKEINFMVDADDLDDKFSLPDGDKAPFQQMTFTLADEQANMIKQNLDKIKKEDGFRYCETFGNENGNGNALYYLAGKLYG
jgi:hypothetical protein